MATGKVDYAALYFKYKTPTPIIGIPTNKYVKQLEQEVCANASSVKCDLDRRDHGYLGLILHNGEYASLSDTPFVAP